jgi:hypothetical protein
VAARAAGRADRTRLQRAREEQADFFFKECLEIADRGKDSENESQARIQRDRLRIDTRKWMAARLAPKKYGGHISHDVQGGRTLNFQPAVLIKVEDEPATELDVSPAANRATRKVAPKDDVRGCNVVLGPTTASYLAPTLPQSNTAGRGSITGHAATGFFFSA